MPAAFQAPRAFLLAGPTTWVLKTALFLNIFREFNPLVTWPDDPLDFGSWFTSLNQSNWHTVVKPQGFLEAADSGVVWGVLISRWATWHDAAHQMLEDAELSVRCDRWLTGDPPPWEGANLRNGTLVIDIVDKSGIYVGSSNGGNIFDGLVRTVVEFGDDFIDSTLDIIADADTPGDYFLPGSKYTDPVKPYAVYQEGDHSPIQTSAYIHSPAKGIQVNVGGHSMPGVNEAISATIQASFDIVGSLIQIGSLGGTVDTLLQPLYEDCQKFDTLIDGPDGKERIDVLAARGEPFRVWSLTPEGERVPAWAALAFKKGTAELHTYTLADGRSITVTKDHRFLTPSGFVRAGDLSVGSRISTSDGTSYTDIAPRQVQDSDYWAVPTDSQVIIDIASDGVSDFYDLHVPGWENYSSADGIWSHNTILAWWSIKSFERAQNAGWSRLFEYFQQGSDRAYTLAALMVLRAGFWATKTQVSWKVTVSDGRPFLIGDRGIGHFFLDDRVGLRLKGSPEIHMDRCRKIDLAWDAENPPEWQITIGDDRIFQDPAQRAWGKIEQLIAGLRDIGVY